MKRYPYDYTGTLEENKFTETRKLTSVKNSDRVIILEHAPFFPNLEVGVVGSSTPLKQGVDYELVYQVTPLEPIASKDIYCGVQILSPLVTGDLTFAGNTVGGDFVDPIQQILDMLVKHLNTPLVGNWKDVEGVPALMPKLATYRDWSDLLNTHYLSTAIDGLADSVEEGGANEEQAVELLRANVAALSAAMDSFNYPAHIAAKNPHSTNNTQINAHPKSLAAADTIMGYGKDFYALCDYIRTRGLTESDIQTYLSEYVTGDVSGTFSFEDGVATIQSQDGTAKIDMNNGKLTISSKGSIYLQADSDTQSSGEYYSFRSGNNELKIVSSGGSMSHQKIYLNGHEILNNRTIMAYQGDAGGGVETVVHTESTTINFSGNGTASDPISGELIIPTATPTVPGKTRIKHTAGSETSGFVAHPKTAKAVNEDLQTLVPDSLRLNDKPLTGSGVTIGKADAKMGNVDNTADLNKPLSDDLAAAVALLANSNHKHNWSDLGIGHATQYDEGIALIANDKNNIPDNQGVSPKVIKQIGDDLSAMAPRYADSLVATDVEFASVEESEFSVSGFTMTPLAPVKYTLSKNNKLVEAAFTGAVDLAAVNNDEWFAVENDCEQRWSKAVIYTNAPSWPKPPAAEYISVTPDYGKPGGVFALKKRLRFKNNEVIFKISADDSYIIYIDGKDVLSGSGATLDVVDMAIEPGRHTIGIRVLDGGGKGYVSFEIYDGDELIDVSDESWPCAELPEMVDPTNNRFYLYGSITTGAITASVTMKPVGSVSAEHLFIGNVTTNYTQAKPNKGSNVAFDTTIDYGSFNELNVHYDEEKAHGGSGQTDIVGLENVTGADVCNGSTVLDVPYLLRRHADYGGLDAIKQSGVITKHSGSGAWATGLRDMYHFIIGHCPAQYHCVKNKLAEDDYTVEGVLHVRNDVEPGACPQWLFVAEGKGADEILVVNPNDLSANPSFSIEASPKLEPSKDPKVVALGTSTPLTVTYSNEEYGTYDAFPTGTNHDPYMFSMCRYRYSPRTNKLTIMLAYEGKYECMDITFDKNMASFFNKRAVGVRSERPTVFGGVIDDLNFPDAIIRRVTSYRALFEAYLSGTDISRYAEIMNGVTVNTDKYATLDEQLADWTPATELLYRSVTSGEIYATHSQPLPAIFCGMEWYSTEHRPVVSFSRFHTDRGYDDGSKYMIPGGAVWYPEKDEVVSFSKTMSLSPPKNFHIRQGGRYSPPGSAQGYIYVYINGVLRHTFVDPADDTITLGEAGSCFVEFRVEAEAGKANGLWLKIDGVQESDTSWRYHMLQGRAETTQYVMPWHTCQAAWERVLRLIENE